jgi:hypothetical protein
MAEIMPALRLDHKQVLQALSVARLKPYATLNGRNTDTLKAYAQNIVLSLALYPVLQQFEVVFRHQIEKILIADFGAQWSTNPIFLQNLDPWANQELTKTLSKLSKINSVIQSDLVVAECTFGFWTSFLEARNNHMIWFKHDKNIFPFATRKQRNIHIIRREFDTLRKLRNRIAHHEPIRDDPQLVMKYQSLIQLLNWMNPHVTLWLQRNKVDRFIQEYQKIQNPKLRKPRGQT